MAKPPAAPTAAARVRKKVKKNVAEGIAHVHASFNNISLPSPPANLA
jgi:small subunit ribosomal protein S11